jgi:hypothetical protein
MCRLKRTETSNRRRFWAALVQPLLDRARMLYGFGLNTQLIHVCFGSEADLLLAAKNVRSYS